MKLSIRKIQINLIVILLLLNISACKEKKEAPQYAGFYSLGEAGNYLLFKPGSWWVYQNTATNETDSLVLLSSSLDTLHAEGEKFIFDYEGIGFITESYRDKAKYAYSSALANPDDPDVYAGLTLECNRIGGYYNKYFSSSALSCQFYHPFEKDKKRANGMYETQFMERSDSIIVNGMTYHDVVSFSVYHDNAQPYPNVYMGQISNSIYYWAKNYGLVKIELQGRDANNLEIDMNWELAASYILK